MEIKQYNTAALKLESNYSSLMTRDHPRDTYIPVSMRGNSSPGGFIPTGKMAFCDTYARASSSWQYLDLMEFSLNNDIKIWNKWMEILYLYHIIVCWFNK